MNAPSDKDVREMLERRAADVRPSPDAWDRIAARLDREPQARRSRHVLVRMPGRRGPRTVGGAPAPATFRWLAAAAVVAVVAVASVVVGDRPPDRRVTTAPPATVPLPAPEAGDDAEDVVAVWPAPTVLGLEAVQARVDAGDQPELLDPEQAARTYLAQRLGFIERGPAPALSVGRFRGEDASNGEVAYVASGVRGTVVLRRVGGEGAIWSVVASTSEHLAVHMFGYDGRRVTGRSSPPPTGGSACTWPAPTPRWPPPARPRRPAPGAPSPWTAHCPARPAWWCCCAWWRTAGAAASPSSCSTRRRPHEAGPGRGRRRRRRPRRRRGRSGHDAATQATPGPLGAAPAGAGRHAEPGSWRLQYSPYTVEGEIEAMGRLAAGARAGDATRSSAWGGWAVVLLVLAPVALALWQLVVMLARG